MSGRDGYKGNIGFFLRHAISDTATVQELICILKDKLVGLCGELTFSELDSLHMTHGIALFTNGSDAVRYVKNSTYLDNSKASESNQSSPTSELLRLQPTLEGVATHELTMKDLFEAYSNLLRLMETQTHNLTVDSFFPEKIDVSINGHLIVFLKPKNDDDNDKILSIRNKFTQGVYGYSLEKIDESSHKENESPYILYPEKYYRKLESERTDLDHMTIGKFEGWSKLTKDQKLEIKSSIHNVMNELKSSSFLEKEISFSDLRLALQMMLLSKGGRENRIIVLDHSFNLQYSDQIKKILLEFISRRSKNRKFNDFEVSVDMPSAINDGGRFSYKLSFSDIETKKSFILLIKTLDRNLFNEVFFRGENELVLGCHAMDYIAGKIMAESLMVQKMPFSDLSKKKGPRVGPKESDPLIHLSAFLERSESDNVPPLPTDDAFLGSNRNKSKENQRDPRTDQNSDPNSDPATTTKKAITRKGKGPLLEDEHSDPNCENSMRIPTTKHSPSSRKP